jgi:CO/xanthine dehydrogenase Mo-binding subunit
MSGAVTRETGGAHRVEGPAKVTGRARYAYEHPVPDAAYAYPVQSAIASGHLGALDSTEALAMPGVLAVLGGVTTLPFGRKDFDLALFTSSEVAYRGQLVGVVIADTFENARAAAAAVRVSYRSAPHDAVLRADHPGLWPGGGKGIGEIGITGTAAAIGNAVYHATGRRIRDLPITPAKLLGPSMLLSPSIERSCSAQRREE